jgi:hypothetical protein
MEGELEGITEASRILLENSNKEIEKRSKKTLGRARALNKLAKIFIRRTRQIEVPEEVSYIRLHNFAELTQKAFVATEVDIRNWFSRISPFFILDRRRFQAVFEKAKNSLKDLQSFLRDDYIKTKTLEETLQLIDVLLHQEEQLENLKNQVEKIQTEKTSFEQRITETKNEIEELKNQENLSRIEEIDKEVKRLRKEVKRYFRHLRKPFMKFQRLIFREGGLTPTESKRLENYIKRPFRTFSTEDEGYPNLKNILRKMNDAIDNDKFNLKSSRKRKAKEDIEELLTNDSLAVLHQKIREMATRKRQLTTSAETERTKDKLQELREKVKKTKKTKERIKLEEARIDRNFKETQKNIREQKKEIEQNILDFLGKKILISLKVQ